MTKLFEVVFDGINSGDCECQCWAVDRETFTRLEGYDPEPDLTDVVTEADLGEDGWPESMLGLPKQDESFDRNRFHKSLYSYYPQYTSLDEPKRKVRVKITVETIEE